MFIKRICIFFISLFFVSFWVAAQEVEPETTSTFKEKEDFTHERDKYIRIGVDPLRYVGTYLQPGTRTGIEFQVDYELNVRFFPVVEGGWHLFDRTSSKFDFRSYGTYFRAGFNYNFLDFKEASEKDIFFMGLRLAGSQYMQRAEGVKLENAFGVVNRNVSTENNSAFWGEFTMGVKTEVAKNWYVGWTARGKLLFNDGGANMPSYIIPGYGKLNALSKTAVDLSFYVAYALPIKRVKK